MTEEWRDVVGFEGRYQVSDLGRVRNIGFEHRGRFLNRVPPRLMVLTPGKHGYLLVGLCSGTGWRGAKRARVHVLVLEAFVGPRPEGTQGAHGDGVKTNNTLGNLRWDTPKGNSADKVAHGTLKFGEAHKRSKLTDPQVREIRSSAESGAALGRRMNVSRSTVSLVRKDKRWKRTG